MAMKVGPGRTHLYYKGTPEFKFGDGLSYSKFTTTLDSPTAMTVVAAISQRVTYSVTIAHAAGLPGKHTVLAMWRPVDTRIIPGLNQKLFDYGSVILQPGQSATVTFELNTHEALAVADSTGNKFLNPGAQRFASGVYLHVSQPEYPFPITQLTGALNHSDPTAGDYDIFFLDGEAEVASSRLTVEGERRLVEEYTL